MKYAQRFLVAFVSVLVLVGCKMETITPNRPVQRATQTTTVAQDVSVADPAAPAAPAAPAQEAASVTGARGYTGDSENSATVKAGDVVTINNPDFSRGYTFTIVSIDTKSDYAITNPKLNGQPESGVWETGHITVSTNEPDVIIRGNGSKEPYFIHVTESYATGYELPIGWARFTPLEKTPVVQQYSMQSGGSVVVR